MFYSKRITTSEIIRGLPAWRDDEIRVQTDVNVDFAFWNPVAKAYDPVVTVEAPGGFLGIPNDRARVTVTGTANLILI